LCARVDDAVKGDLLVHPVAVPKVFGDDLRSDIVDMFPAVVFNGFSDALNELSQEQEVVTLVPYLRKDAREAGE
jgi:hypothetical protein